jgi:cytochrome c biogenesis protein
VTTAAGPIAHLDVDLRQPEQAYPINDHLKLVVLAYYHDFLLDPESQQPTNASFEVKNPVIMGDFQDLKGTSLGRVALMVLAPDKSFTMGDYGLAVEKVDTRWYTALKLHKDKTIPFLYAGLAVVMLGMVITFFLFHWMIWVREEDGKLLIGARAYKNKFGLKQELKRLLGLPAGEATV